MPGSVAAGVRGLCPQAHAERRARKARVGIPASAAGGRPARPEGHGPGRARRLFSETTIEAHLDHLAAGQADDGGWTFNWPAWSPAAERDWRGSLTVDARHVLRAHGRLAS